MADDATDEDDSGGCPACAACSCPAGAPLWMATFSDMMSLMLTFFVLLLSFSEITTSSYKVVAGAVTKAMGVQSDIPVYDSPPGSSVIFQGFDAQTSASMIMQHLMGAVNDKSQKNESAQFKLDIFKDYRGIVLRIAGENMFDTGHVEVRPTAFTLLDDLIALLSQSPDVSVSVEAHTDNTPIQSSDFPSNLHLSAMRAVSVAEYLERGSGKKIAGRMVHSVGRGDTVPLCEEGASHCSVEAANATEEGRTRCRRVEFVFSVVPLHSAPEILDNGSKPEDAPP